MEVGEIGSHPNCTEIQVDISKTSKAAGTVEIT